MPKKPPSRQANLSKPACQTALYNRKATAAIHAAIADAGHTGNYEPVQDAIKRFAYLKPANKNPKQKGCNANDWKWTDCVKLMGDGGPERVRSRMIIPPHTWWVLYTQPDRS